MKVSKGFIHVPILILIVVIVAGGIAYGINRKGNTNSDAQQQTKSSTTNQADSQGDEAATNNNTPATSNLKVYTNTRYGYSFSYPKDLTPYSAVDEQRQVLVPADALAKRVNITTDEKMVFCCESNILSIFAAEQNITPRAWIEANKSQYTSAPQDIISIKDVTIAGRSATELTGAANLSAVYKLLAIKNGNDLLIITQAAKSAELDAVIASLKFIE